MEEMNSCQTLAELTLIKEGFDKEYAITETRIINSNIIKKLSEGNMVGLGYIFDILSEDLFKSDKGRKLINEYINVVKTTPLLKDIVLMKEELLNNKNYLTINEMIKIFNTNDSVINVDKIVNLIESAIVMVDKRIEINEGIENVCNALQYKLTTPKTLKNIKEHIDCDQIIRDFCSDGNLSVTIDDNIENEDVMSSVVADGEQVVFNKLKTECISKLDKLINEKSDDNALSIKNKLIVKEYNQNTVKDDINHLVELSKIIK